MGLNLACKQVTHNDSCTTTIDGDGVNKLGTVKQTHTTKTNLASHLLVRANKQLLACLATRIERTTYLRTTEAAIVEQSAVFTGKWNTLSNHLVDDVD